MDWMHKPAIGTYSHARKPRKLPDGIIDKLGREGLAILLILFALEPLLELISRRGRINRLELPHEHDPGPPVSKKCQPL